VQNLSFSFGKTKAVFTWPRGGGEELRFDDEGGAVVWVGERYTRKRRKEYRERCNLFLKLMGFFFSEVPFLCFPLQTVANGKLPMVLGYFSFREFWGL